MSWAYRKGPPPAKPADAAQPLVHVSGRVPKDVRRKLLVQAHRRGITVSQLLAEILTSALT